MIRWLVPRAKPPCDVAADADALSDLGDEAYDAARDRARAAWTAYRHWDAARRELARRSGRSFLDTATQMLERSRRRHTDGE